MKKIGKDVNNIKDKTVGEVKEVAGKVTDNEQLELNGKLQSTKADLSKKKTNVADKIDDKKENIAKGMNNEIDKNKRTAKKQK